MKYLQDSQTTYTDNLDGYTEVFAPTYGPSPAWSRSYPVAWNTSITPPVECYIDGRYEIRRPCKQALLAANMKCSNPGSKLFYNTQAIVCNDCYIIPVAKAVIDVMFQLITTSIQALQLKQHLHQVLVLSQPNHTDTHIVQVHGPEGTTTIS